MLATLCPKMIVNVLIPVLMAASTLAQRLGMLNTYFWHIAHLALVVSTVTASWLNQLKYSLVWSYALWVVTATFCSRISE